MYSYVGGKCTYRLCSFKYVSYGYCERQEDGDDNMNTAFWSISMCHMYALNKYLHVYIAINSAIIR